MDEQQRGRIVAGSVLILLGVGFLALQFLEGLGESVFFFALGGAFVAGYLLWRVYGLLVPGGILIGVGLGAIGEGAFRQFEDFAAIGLGLGFVLIYVVALAYEGYSHWWPLIPGGILIVSGLASGSVTVERLISTGWPLILIVIGLSMLAGAFGLMDRRAPDEDQTHEDT